MNEATLNKTKRINDRTREERKEAKQKAMQGVGDLMEERRAKDILQNGYELKF